MRFYLLFASLLSSWRKRLKLASGRTVNNNFVEIVLYIDLVLTFIRYLVHGKCKKIFVFLKLNYS